MICHDQKCIFLHIPRCAGSSIEAWIVGRDWWKIDPATKHLTARQARALYAEFWDDYFKFSIVRHPVSRSISCLKYRAHFGLEHRPDGNIDFSGYHSLFGDRIVVEHDHRFHSADAARHSGHLNGQVYGNILDAPIDFIARFETLNEDMEHVRNQLGLKRAFDAHIEKTNEENRPETLPAGTLGKIHRLYSRDFAAFGYEPG